ncbi:MAG: tetrahydrofolate dehydrogenase/cyclohydrolase catalytic domain-containing protein, partial [Bdellovibrionales bacterium]
MTAQIIDGRAAAAALRNELAAHAEDMRARQGGIVPGLAVILVGDDPASHVYVGQKNKICQEIGFRSYAHNLTAAKSEEDILALIYDLNNNPQVNGILVQLPLPSHISE